MAVVCILVLVDVLVLTIWELVDPLVIVVSNKTLEILVSLPSIFRLHFYTEISAVDSTTQGDAENLNACPLLSMWQAVGRDSPPGDIPQILPPSRRGSE